MDTRKLFTIVLLSLIFIGFSYSQENIDSAVKAGDDQTKIATKIDEFGKVGDCDLSARVDNFFIQLNQNRELVGYVIIYAGLDFLPSQYDSHPMRRRIEQGISFRQYEPARLVFIDGGFRENHVTEFWLAPPGAEPPIPTETVPRPQLPKNKTFLWARTSISTEEEYGSLSEFVLPEVLAKEEAEQKLADLEMEVQQASEENNAISEDNSEESEDAEDEENIEEPQLTAEEIKELRFSWIKGKFASQILKQKGSRGLIIFYADNEYYDIAKLTGFVEEARNLIAAEAKISPSQIGVMYGGYRHNVAADYWIVPKGADQPVFSPDERDLPEEEPS